MKVLFAVSNENISEAIVRKYQKDYKEIISYKNVYYFNAILKEIQKDNSYDRIVISEDLEPFANNNYEQIDKFIFDKLDSISDEATNPDRADAPIILICTDRRTKSEDILAKLFSIGIYSAILGNDRNIDEICRLIRVPRTKKEAKSYYRIEAEDATYQTDDGNGVSESEIQNIIAHYKKLGKNEEKYVESFNTIVAQYTDEQLKIIVNFLPLNVKAILETASPKYQQLVTTMTNQGTNNAQEYNPVPQPQNNLKVNYIESKKNKENLAGPVVIPSAVNTKNVKKVNRRVEIEEPEIEIPGFKEPEIEDISFSINEPEEQVAQPKRRGRPRKNPLPESTNTVEPTQPKRRGRPRKNPVEEEPISLFDMVENEQKPSRTEKTNIIEDEDDDIMNGLLPGFDDEDIDDIEDMDISGNSKVIGTLPGFDDEEDDDYNDYNYYEEESNINTRVPNNNQYNNYMPPRPQKNDTYKPNYVKPNPTYMPNNNYSDKNNYSSNTNSREISNTNIDYSSSSINNLLTRDKKLVAFLGTSKNGTSFLVNNVAESLASSGINVAILDTTKNKNAFYIYTKNEEDLRQKSAKCIQKLINGVADGIKVNRNLTVYTSIPEEDVGMNNYEAILSTLVSNYSLVLIDCDFNTDFGYLASAQELYLVQSMDVLTIQPLTAFLRELKTKNILDPDKIRIVINKELRVRNLSAKTIIGGMSFYNDPAMSFMTELFNRDRVKYCTIPFEEETYSKYLEGLVNCKISLNGYSREFLQALKNLENMVYPLIGSRQEYRPTNNYNNAFSSDMNNTLNQMKNKF